MATSSSSSSSGSNNIHTLFFPTCPPSAEPPEWQLRPVPAGLPRTHPVLLNLYDATRDPRLGLRFSRLAVEVYADEYMFTDVKENGMEPTSGILIGNPACMLLSRCNSAVVGRTTLTQAEVKAHVKNLKNNAGYEDGAFHPKIRNSHHFAADLCLRLLPPAVAGEVPRPLPFANPWDPLVVLEFLTVKARRPLLPDEDDNDTYPVILNVYEVRRPNTALKLYLCSIEVPGREYMFTQNEYEGITRIEISSVQGYCASRYGVRLSESIVMGRTGRRDACIEEVHCLSLCYQYGRREVNDRIKWFSHNCNQFASDFCFAVLQKTIPTSLLNGSFSSLPSLPPCPLSPLSYLRDNWPSSSEESSRLQEISQESLKSSASAAAAPEKDFPSTSTGTSHDSVNPSAGGSSSLPSIPIPPLSPLSYLRENWSSSSEEESSSVKVFSRENTPSASQFVPPSSSANPVAFSAENFSSSTGSSQESEQSSTPVTNNQETVVFAHSFLVLIGCILDKSESLISSHRKQISQEVDSNKVLIIAFHRYAKLILALVEHLVDETFGGLPRQDNSPPKKKRKIARNGDDDGDDVGGEQEVDDEEDVQEDKKNKEVDCIGKKYPLTFAFVGLHGMVFWTKLLCRSLGKKESLSQERGLLYGLLDIASILKFFSQFVLDCLHGDGARTAEGDFHSSQIITEMIVKGVCLVYDNVKEASLADDQGKVYMIDGILYMILTVLGRVHQNSFGLPKKCKRCIEGLVAQCDKALNSRVVPGQAKWQEASLELTKKICILAISVDKFVDGGRLLTEDEQGLEGIICSITRILNITYLHRSW